MTHHILPVLLLLLLSAYSVSSFSARRSTSKLSSLKAPGTHRLSLPSTSLQLSASSSIQEEKLRKQRIAHERNIQYNKEWKANEHLVKPDDVLIVSSMPDPLPNPLRNTYYLLRHGQSTGNVEGVISSSRKLATSLKHGLTQLGYRQGYNSATQLLDKLEENIVFKDNCDENDEADEEREEEVIFISSPFARAKQTAQACIDGLTTNVTNINKIQELGIKIASNAAAATTTDDDHNLEINYGLMERYFGRLDDQAIHTYAYVWPIDKYNVTHTAFDVESVAAVATRLRQNVILPLEAKYKNKHIVLVSHADVLQILQLFAIDDNINVGEFSSYRFNNGEVRTMKRTLDSLPKPQPLEAPKRGT